MDLNHEVWVYLDQASSSINVLHLIVSRLQFPENSLWVVLPLNLSQPGTIFLTVPSVDILPRTGIILVYEGMVEAPFFCQRSDIAHDFFRKSFKALIVRGILGEGDTEYYFIC